MNKNDIWFKIRATETFCFILHSLCQCGPTKGPQAACGLQIEFLRPVSFLSIDLMLCACYSGSF